MRIEICDLVLLSRQLLQDHISVQATEMVSVISPQGQRRTAVRHIPYVVVCGCLPKAISFKVDGYG